MQKYLQRLLIPVFALMSFGLMAQEEGNTVIPASGATTPPTAMLEGTDYITKFPNETPDKPVLVEFFSYMCPHCYSTEPMIQAWLKQKPDDVELIRVPVTFGRGQWRLAAKAYYIAEELDVVHAFSSAMFNAIHAQRRPPRNENQLADIFGQIGVSEEAFKKAARSFSVDSKLRKSDYLVRKYQVSAVPYFLVNYKYETAPKRFETQESLFELWNNLPKRDF